MKRLLLYLLPLALVFGLAAMLPADAGVTPSSVTSLRSPTPVLNGPILSGRVLNIGETGVSPIFSPGLQRPVGSMLYTRDGTTAYLKTGTTATAWTTMSGPLSLFEQRTSIAQALLGPTVNTALGTEFESDQWFQTTLVGTGSVAVFNVARSGAVNVQSGATAASTALMKPHGLPTYVDDPKTVLFYAYFRAKWLTAADAQTTATLRLGYTTGAAAIQIGEIGAVSTSNIAEQVCTIGGACASATGGVIDTGAFHDFEFYSGGGTITFRIDGAIVASIAGPANLTTSATYLDAFAGNGTTATNRGMTVDKLVAVVPQD